MWLAKFERGDEAHLEKGELLVTTLNICTAQFLQHDDILLNHDYITLCKLINKICHHLSQIPNKKVTFHYSLIYTIIFIAIFLSFIVYKMILLCNDIFSFCWLVLKSR